MLLEPGFIIINSPHFGSFSTPKRKKGASSTEGAAPRRPAFGREEAVWPPQPPGSAVDSDHRPLSGA